MIEPEPINFDPPLTDAESEAYWEAISDDPNRANGKPEHD